MAYRTLVNAIPTAPTSGTLGGTTPNHTTLHDEARSAIREIADYIDTNVHIATGLTAGDVNTFASANTTALQAALDAVEASGGGTVLLPDGIYRFNNTINIGTRVTYAGSGWNCIHKLADTVSSTATPKPVIASKANTNYNGVRNLMIDGNKANQTDTGDNSHGIDFYSRGTPESMSAPTYDGGLFVDRVMVYNCKGTGFYVRGDTTTMQITKCYSYHNDAFGFWCKTDMAMSDCVAANCGYAGYYAYAGTSIEWTNCKAFGNGQRGAANYGDFLIAYCNTVMLTNCQSEDFAEAGFYILSSNHVTLMGCHAYRGGTQGSPDSLQAGFRLEDDGAGNLCHHVIIFGDVLGGGAGGVKWCLATRNLGPNCYFHLNHETMVNGDWNHFSGSKNNVRTVFNNIETVSENNISSSGTTLALADVGKPIYVTLASAGTLHVPDHGSVQYPASTTFEIHNMGSGQLTVDSPAGAVFVYLSGKGLKLNQYGVGWITKVGYPSNTWHAYGDFVP